MKIRSIIFLLFVLIQYCFSVQYVLTVQNQVVTGNSVAFDLYIRTTNPTDTIFLATSSWGWVYNNQNFTNPQFTIDTGSSLNIKNRAGQEVEELYYSLTANTPNGNQLTSDILGPDPSNQNFFNQRVARISNQPLYHKIGRFRVTGISNLNGYFGLGWLLSYISVWTYQIVPPFNTQEVTGSCDAIPNLLLPVELISQNVPKQFKLNQNYPNPFNPSTIISFDIPVYSHVNIFVIDIMGKLVSTLVDENLSAGSYQIQWNAVKFSSGVYFYKIVTNNYSCVKKLILLK